MHLPQPDEQTGASATSSPTSTRTVNAAGRQSRAASGKRKPHEDRGAHQTAPWRKRRRYAGCGSATSLRSGSPRRPTCARAPPRATSARSRPDPPPPRTPFGCRRSPRTTSFTLSARWSPTDYAVWTIRGTLTPLRRILKHACDAASSVATRSTDSNATSGPAPAPPRSCGCSTADEIEALLQRPPHATGPRWRPRSSPDFAAANCSACAGVTSTSRPAPSRSDINSTGEPKLVEPKTATPAAPSPCPDFLTQLLAQHRLASPYSQRHRLRLLHHPGHANGRPELRPPKPHQRPQTRPPRRRRTDRRSASTTSATPTPRS